jgi:hypothetical protein
MSLAWYCYGTSGCTNVLLLIIVQASKFITLRCTGLSAADLVTLQVDSLAPLALLCFTLSRCALERAVVLTVRVICTPLLVDEPLYQ